MAVSRSKMGPVSPALCMDGDTSTKPNLAKAHVPCTGAEETAKAVMHAPKAALRKLDTQQLLVMKKRDAYSNVTYACM